LNTLADSFVFSKVLFQWHTSTHSVTFRSTSYEIKYHWRDPMKHAEELISDPSLMEFSHFHAEKKFLQKGEQLIPMWDEPWTGQDWFDIEVCPHLFKQTGESKSFNIIHNHYCRQVYLVWMKSSTASCRSTYGWTRAMCPGMFRCILLSCGGYDGQPWKKIEADDAHTALGQGIFPMQSNTDEKRRNQ
jgi:hypothetical protein